MMLGGQLLPEAFHVGGKRLFKVEAEVDIFPVLYLKCSYGALLDKMDIILAFFTFP